ncbi:hypothetical protein [Roseovarius ramblicola]|uniref:Uncharacterized protein n=1 Tax=Roseovarius ramblicola TaxID=2022336 RepID=A0ABV5I2Q1_9RHOB
MYKPDQLSIALLGAWLVWAGRDRERSLGIKPNIAAAFDYAQASIIRYLSLITRPNEYVVTVVVDIDFHEVLALWVSFEIALLSLYADKADFRVDVQRVSQKDGKVPGVANVHLKTVYHTLDLIFAQRAVIAIVGNEKRQRLFDPIEMQINKINRVLRPARLVTGLF